VDDGIEKYNAEKWNSYDLVVCDNNKKRNDVKFLSSIIEKLKQKYAIDTNRIYMVGFSNGGEMAARCAIELSNKLAAVVSCAGALPPNFNASPQRLLPVFLQMGSADQKLMAKVGSPTPFRWI
jgi:polyhydroxybutyrate depolymerase